MTPADIKQLTKAILSKLGDFYLVAEKKQFMNGTTTTYSVRKTDQKEESQ